MTNKEYLTELLNGLNISEGGITIILLKSGLDADAVVAFSDCDKAVYNRMSVVLKGMAKNTSISEGGYSESETWNMEDVKLFYNSLCNELGLENVLVGRPKVRNRSNLW